MYNKDKIKKKKYFKFYTASKYETVKIYRFAIEKRKPCNLVLLKILIFSCLLSLLQPLLSLCFKINFIITSRVCIASSIFNDVFSVYFNLHNSYQSNSCTLLFQLARFLIENSFGTSNKNFPTHVKNYKCFNNISFCENERKAFELLKIVAFYHFCRFLFYRKSTGKYYLCMELIRLETHGNISNNQDMHI